MKYIVEVFEDGNWIQTSSHKNLDYAEANYEVKLQRYKEVRIRKGTTTITIIGGRDGNTSKNS